MSDHMNDVSRRTILKSVAGTALAAAFGGPLLAACGSASKDSTKADQAVRLPTYRAINAVAPDLPGSAAGVLPAWLTYPAKLTAAPSPPGKGGTVTALLPLFTPPPPPLPGNKFWAEANKRFGMQWKPTLAPIDTYPQKLQTSIAGGDLPDIVFFTSSVTVPQATVAQQPQLLDARFADLTDHLSGDAVLKYKNIANIPSAAFVAAVANGKIYGVPITRGQAGPPIFVRRDLFKAAGINTDPKTLADLYAACGELTDAKRSRWAVASAPDAVYIANAAFGTPNQWRVSGGKLTADLETDEYLSALEWSAKLHKAGYLYPDVSTAGTPVKQVFGSGRAAVHVDSDSSWPGFLIDNAKTPGFELGAMLPPTDSGRGGALFANGATLGYAAFKKASDSRIAELLSIVDLAASTFGTDTSQFLAYGVIGVDSTMSKNGPVINDRGNSELNCNLRYLGSAPPTNFIADYPDQTKLRHQYETETVPHLITNPVDGLYSPTQGSKGAVLSKMIFDGLNDVVLGRKPLSSWKDTVSSWRSQGGDAMRTEFEKALANKPHK